MNYTGHNRLPPLGRNNFIHYLGEKQTQTSKKKFGNRTNPEQIAFFNNYKDKTEAEGGEGKYL